MHHVRTRQQLLYVIISHDVCITRISEKNLKPAAQVHTLDEKGESRNQIILLIILKKISNQSS